MAETRDKEKEIARILWREFYSQNLALLNDRAKENVLGQLRIVAREIINTINRS